MFGDITLISEKEDSNLFAQQNILIKKIVKNHSHDALMRLALLQALAPICDYNAAVCVLEKYMIDDFEFLIIGAYLNARCLNRTANIFIDALLKGYDQLEKQEKCIVKYLMVLHEYNRINSFSENMRCLLDEAIENYQGFVAPFYLRYLDTNRKEDKEKAKENVGTILTEEEILKLSIDQLICPQFFIEEQIVMQTLSKAAYEAMFCEGRHYL